MKFFLITALLSSLFFSYASAAGKKATRKPTQSVTGEIGKGAAQEYSFEDPSTVRIVYKNEKLRETASYDPCIRIALDKVTEYIMDKMDDPSDLDQLHVAQIKTIKASSQYLITAGEGPSSADKEEFSVTANCSATVNSSSRVK